jgi:asparagine synthase (glutamine-hydrolysing)
MSVQFGSWNFAGQPPAPEYIEKVGTTLAPYGPDSKESYSKDGLSILYRAFHTTKQSRCERQPHVSSSGTVITWDGRLDNRVELIDELCELVAANPTDVAIVATLYEKWGTKCLKKLIGDWALSIWNPRDHSLLLAKDPIGVRHLYYSFDNTQVTWSTILDPLVQFAGKTFALNEEYIAGWLTFFPASHLTPYVGIRAVPPSSSVIFHMGKHMVSRYWDFDPSKRIRYRTDSEYEEHFRAVFAKAVEHCLRSDLPVLSELSGGRDSSSIVCMADTLIARGAAETSRLDTVSYYDDSEPNWNERPYFTKVEERRGHTGWHIDMGAPNPPKNCALPNSESPNDRCLANPGTNGRLSAQFRACLTSQGNRVVLSGIGGDEVMGGSPTPKPELEDFLATAQFRTLAHQLEAWALQMKKPWLHLFLETVRGFLPDSVIGLPKYMRPAPWLQSRFVKRHWRALTGYPFRVKLFGPLPSFQHNVAALEGMRRQLACSALPLDPPYEKRYPYLDRDLLEFMYAIPREQVVRPSKRRSLMRRALVGVVPDEILNRRTKAFVSRAPLVAISTDWGYLTEMTHNMLSSSLGIVDSECLYAVLQKARRGDKVPIVTLMRTMKIEAWLKGLRASGTVNLRAPRKPV